MLFIRIGMGLLAATVGITNAQEWEIRPLTGESIAKQLPGVHSQSAQTLASADFNNDGLPDLVAGYRSAGGGEIILAARQVSPQQYPALAQHKIAAEPFGPFQSVVRTSNAPDFLVAGDFDADANNDLVSAAIGAFHFDFHPGNGDGTFGPTRRMYPGGAISNLIAGEVNRRDGLTDLVIATNRGGIHELLVYQGPTGAITHPPEGVRISGAPSALVLGQFDTQPDSDVAFAVNQTLGVVHGRDRRLSSTSLSSPPPLWASSVDLDTSISGLAGGEWIQGRQGQQELAVLTRNGHFRIMTATSSHGASADGQGKTFSEKSLVRLPTAGPLRPTTMSANGSDLWFLGDGNMHVVRIQRGLSQTSVNAEQLIDQTPGLSAVLPLRLTGHAQLDLVAIEKRSGNLVLVTPKGTTPIVVDTATDPQPIANGDGCTLREAIENANDDAQTHPDCVAGSGADTITFAINGGGNPATVVLSNELPPLSGTVTIDGATQCTLPPCVQLDGNAIQLNGATTSDGLSLTGSSSVIRGMIISGFPLEGIRVGGAGGHIIEGNHIGLDLAGTAADGVGRTGMVVQSPDNLIGGRTAADRNVISGNGGTAISVINFGTGTDATRNRIEGNFIGTDPTGLTAQGNVGVGIFIGDAANNVFGGTEPGSGNVTAANLRGVVIDNFLDPVAFVTENNLIQGNLVGLNSAGEALGNTEEGVIIFDSRNNMVGGTTVAARNVISNNTRGIWVWPTELIDTTGNVIQGNYLGTDLTGNLAQPNSVSVALQNTTQILLGGTVPNAGNVMSANTAAGLQVQSNGGAPSADNIVQGNFIGTNAAGDAALGNAFQGIFMNNTTGNMIGGPDVGAGNVVSDNGFNGISLEVASGNTVQGNFVGTTASGDLPLPNRAELGIVVNESSDNQILGNRIGGNGGTGLQVRVGTNNRLSENLIAGNFSTGIDLGQDGVTANDPGDSDSGPNNLQNFPTIDSVTNNTRVSGSLNSMPSASYTIEFFANADCSFREGRRFLGSSAVVTDGSGDASIAATLASNLAPDTGITATAIDAAGNTSEFSACVTVDAVDEVFADGFEEAAMAPGA